MGPSGGNLPRRVGTSRRPLNYDRPSASPPTSVVADIGTFRWWVPRSVSSSCTCSVTPPSASGGSAREADVDPFPQLDSANARAGALCRRHLCQRWRRHDGVCQRPSAPRYRLVGQCRVSRTASLGRTFTTRMAAVLAAPGLRPQLDFASAQSRWLAINKVAPVLIYSSLRTRGIAESDDELPSQSDGEDDAPACTDKSDEVEMPELVSVEPESPTLELLAPLVATVVGTEQSLVRVLARSARVPRPGCWRTTSCGGLTPSRRVHRVAARVRARGGLGVLRHLTTRAGAHVLPPSPNSHRRGASAQD